MKKYLFLILMAAAFALMLCGCGGDPLEKAYDSLSKAQSDQDGDRSEVIRDDRIKYSEQIKDLLRAHGKQFVTVSGSYQERYETAAREVNALLQPACN